WTERRGRLGADDVTASQPDARESYRLVLVTVIQLIKLRVRPLTDNILAWRVTFNTEVGVEDFKTKFKPQSAVEGDVTLEQPTSSGLSDVAKLVPRYNHSAVSGG
ncbi:hypothetical protein J6590_059151, partial [Homalodisca vitripennis]